MGGDLLFFTLGLCLHTAQGEESKMFRKPSLSQGLWGHPVHGIGAASCFISCLMSSEKVVRLLEEHFCQKYTDQLS